MHMLHARKGAVSMMTILIMSGILIEISLTGLVVSYLGSEQGLATKASDIALYAARSGVHDMILRVARDKTFVPSTNPYTVNVSGGSASVSVTRTLPDSTHIQYTIESTGRSIGKRIKVTSTVIIDDTSGAISSQTVTESGV